MREFILEIPIYDPDYVDQLIVALTRQGYAPFLSDHGDALNIVIEEEFLHEQENTSWNFPNN